MGRLVLLGLLTFPPSRIAADRVGSVQQGVWVKEDRFAQINVYCLQTWTCVPGKDVMHSADTKVVTTAPKSVRGVCSAAGGAADSCNFCASSAPTDRCEWWIEKR